MHVPAKYSSSFVLCNQTADDPELHDFAERGGLVPASNIGELLFL